MSIEKEIESLALSRSICYVRQQRNVCNPESCEYCDIFIKQNEAYSSLPAAAQLAVNNRVYYQAADMLSRTPPVVSPWVKTFKVAGKTVFIGFLIYLLWAIAL